MWKCQDERNHFNNFVIISKSKVNKISATEGSVDNGCQYPVMLCVQADNVTKLKITVAMKATVT